MVSSWSLSRSLLLVAVVLQPNAIAGFAVVGGRPQRQEQQQQHRSVTSTTTTTALQATPSRRSMVLSTGAWIFGTITATTSSSSARAADAEIDYSKIQDLLGSSASSSSTSYNPAPSGKRPTYLTEPTEEFKQNEAKASEFKRQNLISKKEFQGIIDRFESAPNSGDALANSLDEMRRYVKREGGLPLGITKKELITIIRRRKSKKFWPTDVEIAYQDLLLEIQYQQSPNTQKNEENPL